MKCCPTRYSIAILTTIGTALLYGLRVNINLTIVQMVNKTGTQSASGGVCTNRTRVVEQGEGEYDWPDYLQGIILSSFYWGYLVALIPCARLCELTSVKWVWFSGVSLCAVGCLLTPICCDIHYTCVIAARILQGFATGATIPATSLLLARWIPLNERNTWACVMLSGTTIGMVVNISATGAIEIHLGWRACFYIMGSMCAPYLVIWAIFAGDSPDKARYISKEEVDLILDSFGDKAGEKKKVVILWKNILKSKPFWALFITHGCGNWVGYFLVVDLPTYLDKVFQTDMDHLTTYIAIGGTLNGVFSISFGLALDFIKKKKKFSQTWAKKVSTLVTYVPITAISITMAYVGCQEVLAVILMILTFMLLGGAFSGYLSNHADIGPKIAGTLMAFTNTAGTVSGIVVPIFVGAIIGDGKDLYSWTIIFWVNAGFVIFLIVTYTIFGSGERQNYYREEDVPQKDLVDK